MNKKETLLEKDIITMLDQFMAKGGGHMNIDINLTEKPSQTNLIKQIKETKSSECNTKQMACQVPTLHEGLDQ